MTSNTYAKRVEAARRYAAADKSDPFSFNRAMSHMQNGIAGFNLKCEDAFYSADEARETRVLPDDGRPIKEREYQAIVYTNRQRP